MSFLRAASVTAALALVVSSVGGSIPLAGQAGAPAIGRRIERYRGRPVIAGEVLVRFRGAPAAPSLAASIWTITSGCSAAFAACGHGAAA